MDKKDILKYAENNPDKYDEKEKKDNLNAAKVSLLCLIVIEFFLITIKIVRKEDFTENFGVMFLILGAFYLQLYSTQKRKRDLIEGIIQIILGIIFMLGYLGSILSR